MRILFLASGEVNHTHRWVEYFAAAGHDVHLLTFEPPPAALPGEHHLITSRLPRKGMLRYLGCLGTVRRIARSIAPDIVSAHELGSYGPLGVLCGVRPVAVSAWGSDVLLSPARSWFHRARITYCLRRADLITSMADHMSARIVALGGDPAKIVVNHFGVDDGVFTMTSRPPRPADEVVMVHSRHFKPVYNYEMLLGALPEILGALPRARLVFLSDGPLRPWVEGEIARAGLVERVEFRGMQAPAAVAAALRDADIFLTTSRSDGANISLLEAMAAGCYPVVADIPATRQWLDAGGALTLVRLDDAPALAAAVISAARDVGRRERARAHNHRVVQARGLWRDNMRRSEEAFEKLAAAFHKP